MLMSQEVKILWMIAPPDSERSKKKKKRKILMVYKKRDVVASQSGLNSSNTSLVVFWDYLRSPHIDLCVTL